MIRGIRATGKPLRGLTILLTCNVVGQGQYFKFAKGRCRLRCNFGSTPVEVSGKGIVQVDEDADLPTWMLSAMKYLANWPKPMKMLKENSDPLPNYPDFINDVFTVVKDYFLQLGSPLVPYQLHNGFISAYIKAEALGARPNVARPAGHCRPRQSRMQSSTPSMTSDYLEKCHRDNNILLQRYERTARIMSTVDVAPGLSSTNSSFGSNGSSSCEAHFSGLKVAVNGGAPVKLHADMSTTAIMRNFLPPQSCFETAFMHEQPITRIVPQKEKDTLHLQQQEQDFNCGKRQSTGFVRGTRSTRGLDSDAEARQPRWRRSSRHRKSIAIMDSVKTDNVKGVVNQGFQESPSRISRRSKRANPSDDTFTSSKNWSVDNLLDSGPAWEPDTIGADPYMPQDNTSKLSVARDNVIFSKAVRKEKKKQREKRERAHSADRVYQRDVAHRSSRDGFGLAPVPISDKASSTTCIDNGRRFYTSTYNNLIVKTPMDAFDNQQDMYCVRAEPYRNSNEHLSHDGFTSAIDSFKLLGLLLPPANRRKLQLLLKFIKRVASNVALKLDRFGGRSNMDLLLDTFCVAILKPPGISPWDEELCRKIVHFFTFNFSAIWMPPENLRRVVEEKVYHSLVSRRLQAGEDPFPITYCQRVSRADYQSEKTETVKSAMRDLLQQILTNTKMNDKERKKKLKKFKVAYPDIFRERFPTEEDEPDIMTRRLNSSFPSKLSSFSKLRSTIRI